MSIAPLFLGVAAFCCGIAVANAQPAAGGHAECKIERKTEDKSGVLIITGAEGEDVMVRAGFALYHEAKSRPRPRPECHQ